MNDEKIASIKEYQKSKSTEELLSIWVENDTEDWDEEAFAAIKEILIEREVALPKQKTKNEAILSKHYDWDETKIEKYLKRTMLSAVTASVGAIFTAYCFERDLSGYYLGFLFISSIGCKIFSATQLWGALNALNYRVQDKIIALLIVYGLCNIILSPLGIAWYWRKIKTAIREKATISTYA